MRTLVLGGPVVSEEMIKMWKA